MMRPLWRLERGVAVGRCVEPMRWLAGEVIEEKELEDIDEEST